jgi:hypothetical protein
MTGRANSTAANAAGGGSPLALRTISGGAGTTVRVKCLFALKLERATTAA